MTDMERVAQYLILRLKQFGFKIQRYDSITTNSIYLKLDYGVGNSIRISDHKGKKHLQYRYNVIANHKGVNRHKSPQGWPRYYYGFGRSDLNIMIRDILKARDLKIQNYGIDGYARFMMKNQADGEDKKGFWQSCVEV